MHIGLLTPEYVMEGSLDGGLANYTRKVGLELTDRGHQVSVLVLSSRNACWQDNRIAVYEVKRVVVPKWLRRRFHAVVAQVLSSKRLKSLVWKIHSATPFDLLQASSYMAPGYTLRRNGIIPLVCRVSSYAPLLRSAYGRQRNMVDCVNDWFEIRQVLDAEASFAPSNFMATTFARFEGYKPHVLHTPLDFQDISNDPSYYQKHLANTPYLLLFGTLSRIKGVDLLAKVIPPILERHKNLALVFIGRDDGLPNGQKMLDFICQHCGPFKDKIHYHPALPKTQLYPIIANTLGVLMPSRVDNYPNACLEAQSLSVPVVGTYESSLEEMIIDGETGFMAKNGDPESLLKAIKRLLAMTPNEREQMQERISSVIRSISSEDRIGQLISFYEATISNFRLTVI
jgi:glycosyltransferase involved in cell wall biosynthesis